MLFSRIISVIISSFIIILIACSGDSNNNNEDRDTGAVADTSKAYSISSWSGFAEVNGARIYYEVAGEGEPLVMLHAGIADSRMWRKQQEYFSRYYKVITYDLRGFGKTVMPDGQYAHYRDLAGLLDTLRVDKAILLGCSMGGSVAIDFTLEYPERVKGLVLVSSALDGYRFEDKETKKSWKEIDKAVKKRKFDKAADLEIAQWIVGSGRSPEKVDQAVKILVREMLMTYYKNGNGKGEEQGPEEFAIDRLTEITVPTLIVTGGLDAPDILNITELLNNEIANSRRVTITDTAHLPSLEQSDGFNILVYDFLNDKGL